jgi:hypothetical protein
MSPAETVTVWRADRRYRLAAIAVIAVLLLLSARVLLTYGYLALVGVALVFAVVVQTWWTLLRPKLSAGPDGVDVVSGRAAVHLAWKEIRRCEPGPTGLKIVCSNGREVIARYPQQRSASSAEPTEADLAAAYLAQRAAWARKPSGPAPTYVPPPPVKAGKPASKFAVDKSADKGAGEKP